MAAAFFLAIVIAGLLATVERAWADDTVYPYGEPPAAATEACPAGGSHVFTETTLSDPTEEEDGVRLYTCSQCGYSFMEAIPHTGHDWGPWIVDVEPTCTSEGHEYRECDRYPDDPHFEDQTIPALSDTGEHTWGDWIVDVQPTETAEGSEHRVCSVCGATETQALPVLQTTVVQQETGVDEGQTTETTETAQDAADETEDAGPARIGPFIASFSPNATDAVIDSIGGAAIIYEIIILVPLVAACIWLRHRKADAREKYTSDLHKPEDEEDPR